MHANNFFFSWWQVRLLGAQRGNGVRCTAYSCHFNDTTKPGKWIFLQEYWFLWLGTWPRDIDMCIYIWISLLTRCHRWLRSTAWCLEEGNAEYQDILQFIREAMGVDMGVDIVRVDYIFPLPDMDKLNRKDTTLLTLLPVKLQRR